MNKTELLNMVCEMIEKAGYKKMATYDPNYYRADKMEINKVERRNTFTNEIDEITEYYGLAMNVSIVNKHNGADDDVSVDVAVNKWNRNSTEGRLHKVRVTTKQSETAIRKKVESIMNFYNTFVKVA